MSKRRLSQQQTRRIRQQQRQRLSDSQNTDTPSHRGLIIAHHGKKVLVQAEDNSVHKCHFRANLETLVAGDRVLWQEGKPYGVVTAIESRDSLLSRPDPYGKVRPVAANIDQIIVVNSVTPPPSTQLIDRYLVAAHASDIKPILVLNKIDLLQTGDTCREDLAIYTELGYELHELSAHTSEGIEHMRALCSEHTSIIVGQSGVGKSSIVNRLLGDEFAKVGALSESSEQGTHTTTTARLYDIDSGGRIIDSPGIREFGLWHLSDDDVVNGYIELAPLVGHCKFRDCRHQQEPGCAILEAFETDRVSPQRVTNFHALRQSIIIE